MSYYQTIYNRLRQHGISEAGALGFLGNWDCESNCEPYRVQGDFSSYRSISKAYVNSLNTGALTRDLFMHDQKGFGLAQWTYFSRKAELYDEWKKLGCLIDDPVFQTDFAMKELKQDNGDLYRYLLSTNNVYDACSRICVEFERPYHNNVDARFQSATRIKSEIDLNAWSGEEALKPTESSSSSTQPQEAVTVKPELIPATDYWPPRDVDQNMHGYDVMVLQAVLKARGYPVTIITGDFDAELDKIVRQFQEAYQLGADGVVGPKTWKKLLELSRI